MKVRKFKSLSFKLTLWYFVILGIILLTAGILLYQGFKNRRMNDLDDSLFEVAVEVDEIWMRARGKTWMDAVEETKEIFSFSDPFIMVVRLAREKWDFPKEIIQSGRFDPDDFLLDRDIYYEADKMEWDDIIYVTRNMDALSSYPMRIVLLPVRGPYLVQVGISMEQTIGQQRQLVFIMILTGFLFLLVASAGGSFFIRRALVPVKSVVRTARNITADDLTLRIEAKNRQDEIGALVDTFNDMIARLENSVKKIRKFSGDVSHELRTPLTVIRGEVEVILRKDRKKEDYQKTLKSVLEESLKMEKIIDDLLFLSRLDASEKREVKVQVNLGKIVRRIFESRKKAAGNKGLSLSLVCPSDVVIDGDADLIERLVVNILDNAIRYTQPGGNISITLEKEKKSACLSISDTGIGIPKGSIPFIFDRFYVVDKSRSRETGGSGLGLSIVKWAADFHGAEIDVKSRLKKGTTFTIKFKVEDEKDSGKK